MIERLGEILLATGKISPNDLTRARRLQKRRGGHLGPILASMGLMDLPTIDAAWADAMVMPGVEAAVDRVCGNRFTRLQGRKIHFETIAREETLVEDMMAGAAISESSITIKGSAILMVEDTLSLSFNFELDPTSGLAVLDGNSGVIVRRWLDLLDRNRHSKNDSTQNTGSVATNFDSVLANLLKKTG